MNDTWRRLILLSESYQEGFIEKAMSELLLQTLHYMMRRKLLDREECIPDKRKNTSKDLEVVKEHVSYRAL